MSEIITAILCIYIFIILPIFIVVLIIRGIYIKIKKASHNNTASRNKYADENFNIPNYINLNIDSNTPNYVNPNIDSNTPNYMNPNIDFNTPSYINQNSNSYTSNFQLFPYEKCSLLTFNEQRIYEDLEPIANKYNLKVIAKTRMADLVNVVEGLDSKNWAFYFGKIKSKHIDFALCESQSLQPILLIEVDDSSHYKTNRRERDFFIETVYKQTGYNLLRITNSFNLEEKICDILNIPVNLRIK